MTPGDDRMMMLSPQLWPHFPVLPLKNLTMREKDGFPRFGLLFGATGNGEFWFFDDTTMFERLDLEKAVPGDVELIDQLIADGWIVD